MTPVRASGLLLWITFLWVLLWGNLSVANALSGLAVAVVVLVVARLPRLSRPGAADSAKIAPLATLRFGVFVLVKLIEANLVLAWEIVTPRNRIHTGVVQVPLRTESDLALMVVANVVTLTPGTITIEVEQSPPVLYVHVLHLHDLDAVRRDLLRIEELSVRAFGSSAARAQLARNIS
jgi:multicomponent Na+:H+ antiporter subunit E